MFRRSGFSAEMEAIAQVLAQGEQHREAACISDGLIDAICLVGPSTRCQEQLAVLHAAGVTYPPTAPQAVQEDQETPVRRCLSGLCPALGGCRLPEPGGRQTRRFAIYQAHRQTLRQRGTFTGI